MAASLVTGHDTNQTPRYSARGAHRQHDSDLRVRAIFKVGKQTIRQLKQPSLSVCVRAKHVYTGDESAIRQARKLFSSVGPRGFFT